MSRSGTRILAGFLPLGLLSTLVFALRLGTASEIAAQAVVVLGCLICLAAGPYVYRSRSAVPWRLMFVAALVILNRVHGRLDWSALADGVIICLGVGLLAVVEWVLPAVHIAGRPWSGSGAT